MIDGSGIARGPPTSRPTTTHHNPDDENPQLRKSTDRMLERRKNPTVESSPSSRARLSGVHSLSTGNPFTLCVPVGSSVLLGVWGNGVNGRRVVSCTDPPSQRIMRQYRPDTYAHARTVHHHELLPPLLPPRPPLGQARPDGLQAAAAPIRGRRRRGRHPGQQRGQRDGRGLYVWYCCVWSWVSVEWDWIDAHVALIRKGGSKQVDGPSSQFPTTPNTNTNKHAQNLPPPRPILPPRAPPYGRW